MCTVTAYLLCIAVMLAFSNHRLRAAMSKVLNAKGDGLGELSCHLGFIYTETFVSHLLHREVHLPIIAPCARKTPTL